MQNFNRAIIGLTALSLLTLTACGGKKEADVEITPQKVQVPAAPSIAGGANPAALLGAVTEATTAVKAGDFATAGKSVEKFSGAWKTVGPMIQTKNPKAYTAITDGVTKVQEAIKKKDAASATAALTSLQTALAVVK